MKLAGSHTSSLSHWRRPASPVHHKSPREVREVRALTGNGCVGHPRTKEFGCTLDQRWTASTRGTVYGDPRRPSERKRCLLTFTVFVACKGRLDGLRVCLSGCWAKSIQVDLVDGAEEVRQFLATSSTSHRQLPNYRLHPSFGRKRPTNITDAGCLLADAKLREPNSPRR